MDRRVEIIRATPEHAEEVAANMRPEDQTEMLALGLTPRFAITQAVRHSLASYAGIGNGEVKAIFGVSRMGMLSHTGVPWMLSANGIDFWGKSVGLESVKFHRTMKQRFRRLENVVHAANYDTIRWLEWLGYTIEPESPFGPYGAPFRRFWMEV